MKNEIDYKELVLIGYFDENNREHLEDYFYQEFIEAEKLPGLFFGGCSKAVEWFENDIKRQYHDQKKGLYHLQSFGTDEGKEIARTELETISLNDFNSNLSNYSPKYYGLRLWYIDILTIKRAILATAIKVNSEQQQEKKKQIEDMISNYPTPATSSGNQISIPVLALKYYYLQTSKTVDQTKEAFLAENGRSESIKNFGNTYYAIGKESEKDPLKEAYLKKVIPLLENYPLAKQLAENDLYSFLKGVTKR